MVTGTLTLKTMTAAVNQQQSTMPLKEAPSSTQGQISAPVAPVKSDRRSNKPIMEKRRRARINNCLNELKTLILDATKKDPARHSKLEKADILEKTVKHLQELQRQQSAMQQAIDPKIINKFKAGFTECANEVSRFPDIDPQVKRRLMQHLSNCINGVKSELGQLRQRQVAAAAAAAAAAQQQGIAGQQQPTQTPIQPVQIHMLPSPPSSPEQDSHHSGMSTRQQQQMTTTTIAATQIQATPNGYFLPNGVQVYPTKLANGTLALILPQQQAQQQQSQQLLVQQTQQQHQQQHIQSQLPMLVPIPNRTASTGSATSVSSSYDQQRIHSPISQQQMLQHHHHLQQQHQSQIHYAPPSPANSYEAMDCQYTTSTSQHQQQSQSQSVIHHASSHHQQSPQQQCQSPSMLDAQYYSAMSAQRQQQYDDIEDDGSAPLSLVIKKHIKEEEQPWRPW